METIKTVLYWIVVQTVSLTMGCLSFIINLFLIYPEWKKRFLLDSISLQADIFHWTIRMLWKSEAEEYPKEKMLKDMIEAARSQLEKMGIDDILD